MSTAPTDKGYSLSSIRQGPGDLWIIGGGVADSATPQLTLDLPTGTPDTTAHPSSICLGTSVSGITTTVKVKISDIMADQFEAPIDAFMEQTDALMEAEMLQQSVDLLQYAYTTGVYSTVAGPPGYKQVTGGGINIVPSFCFAAISPKRTGTNLWDVTILFKAISKGGLEALRQRKKTSSHKLQLAAQSDITRVAGRQIFNHYETL